MITSVFDMTIPTLERYHHREPLTVGKMNQAVDTLNRITRGIQPPRQKRDNRLNKKKDKEDDNLFPLFGAVLDFQNITPLQTNIFVRDVHSIPTGEDNFSTKWVVTPVDTDNSLGIRRQVLIAPPFTLADYSGVVLDNDMLNPGDEVPVESIFIISKVTMVNQFNNFSVGKISVISSALR